MICATRKAAAAILAALGLAVSAGCSSPQALPTAAFGIMTADTPTHSATETPAATSTMQFGFPALPDASIPQNIAAIDPDNATHVVSLARWGIGVLTQTAWSADGRVLATGSATGVSFFDSQTSEWLGHIDTPEMVTGLCFLAGEEILVGGLADGTVRLWKASDGSPVRILEGHTEGINSIACSPDGAVIVSGFPDGAVHVWNAAEGSLESILEGLDGAVIGLSFSGDGTLLAGGSDEGMIAVWNIATGERVAVFTLEYAIYSLAFSPTEDLLAAGSDRGTVLFRFAGLEPEFIDKRIDVSNQRRTFSLSFSPDGTLLAIGYDNGIVRVRDLATTYQTREITNTVGPVRCVTFSPDGTRLAIGSRSKTALWRVSDGAWLNTPMEGSDGILDIDFSPDSLLLADASASKAISFRNSLNGEIQRVTQRSNTFRIAFSTDGTFLLVGSNGEVFAIPVPGKPTMDPVYLAVGGYYQYYGFALSPKQDILCISTGWEGNTIRFLSFPDLHSLYDTGDHTYAASHLAFSPDGKWLAGVTDDNAVRLWRVSDGFLVATMKGHSATVNSLAFSPDGSLLASGSADETIRVWKVSTGSALEVLEGHSGGVNGVAFSPDGSLLVSGSADASLRLWRIADGETLHILDENIDGVNDVAFSPSGLLIASGSADGTIGMWGVLV
ncbi:MAG: hypothetical protein ACK2UB_11910 [Anaerolineales bacterium]